MALHRSVAVRNAQLDAYETTAGVSPKLQIWTGASPANTAAAATGTKLVEMTLPSDWMANASSGSKAMLGTWSAAAIATGTALGGYYRIVDSAGTTCHEQGDIGTEMTLDNNSVTVGQTVTVATYTVSAGNS